MPPQPQEEPGAAAERVLAQMPEADLKPFLAYLEQKYRREGDLVMLREVRAYRAKHNL
jgi:hypothetical protein